MPHLSQHKLPKETEKRVIGNLSELIKATETRSQVFVLLNNLFTPTERLMFAKRLAIIHMLSSGKSVYKISLTLKVSPSTVERLRNQYESGSFDELISILDQKKQRTHIEAVISLLASGRVPTPGNIEKYKRKGRGKN